MSFFKQCILIFALLFGLIAFQGGHSLLQIRQVSDSSVRIASGTSLASRSRDLWDAFRSVDLEIRRAMEFTDFTAGDELGARVRPQIERLRALLDEMAKDDKSPAIADLRTGLERWSTLVLPHLSSQGQTEVASYDVLDRAREDLAVRIDAYANGHLATARDLVGESERVAASATWWAALGLAAGMLASALLGWYAVRTLRARLGGEPDAVVDAARRLAAGDLSQSVRVVPGDRVSVTAAMAQMQESLRAFEAEQQEMARQHEAGMISHGMDVEKFAGAYRQMAQSINTLV
ncbi:MAG: hypothetical protein IT508_03520, partial [Burkholderiaceae bacterium]|nr:hypothetical protein [Burkholderiaceae bacterium]